MSIIVNKNSKILVQGITGKQGAFHTKQMLNYGSQIVAGLSPGKSGTQVEGVPVYDTVTQALENHDIDTSVLFIPAPFVKDAAFEALMGGIGTLIIITEHVPLHDAMEIMALAKERDALIVGPNTFGVISPGQCKVGIMPNQIFKPGKVGLVARSGTLSYEIAANLSQRGIGQSTVIGLGGDRVVGLSFTEVLTAFEKDSETEVIVLVGEIGGNAEELAAEYIKTMKKPVVAFLAGKSAPPGKRMGHAGAIVERGKGTFESKVEALTAAGAKVAELPWEVADLVEAALAATVQG